MTIVPRLRTDARCRPHAGGRRSCTLPVVSMKISQCKANTVDILTCRGIWMGSPRSGSGAGEAAASTQSRALQRRNGCEAGRPEQQQHWMGWTRPSGVRGAASALRLGPWKNRSLAFNRPSSPPRNFGTFFGWWNPSPELSQAIPQSAPHHSTYNTHPILSHSLPLPLSLLCVLPSLFVLDTLHSVAD